MTPFLEFCARNFPWVQTEGPVATLAASFDRIGRDGPVRLLANMPQASSKTLLATTLLPPWLLYNDPDKRVLLVVSSLENVECARVRSKASAAVQPSGTHSSNSFELARADGVLPFKPFDVVIVDAWTARLSERSTSAETRRERAKGLLERAVMRLAPGGSLVVFETRGGEYDLTGHIESSSGYEAWQHLIFPATSSYGFHSALKRDIGSREWRQEYLQQQVD
jgi:hypothetical protein